MNGRIIIFILINGLYLTVLLGCNKRSVDIVRPEKVVSIRQIYYDTETYSELSNLWQKYYNEFPSEDAYSNWMYAARYAGDEKYKNLLSKGLKKYPGNPTILYLSTMTEHGKDNDLQGRSYLERAAALDPSYMDPWFALVGHYMNSGDDERLSVALNELLHSGIIPDEVMDYSYNMLISMKKNSIIITNGDNDTYPGLILTKVLNIRPDITIVNGSFINTDWFINYLNVNGLPLFITKDELASLKNSQKPPWADTLFVYLINMCKREGKAVYFAATYHSTKVVDEYRRNGYNLGLVTLVTPSELDYGEELRQLCEIWLHEYRTGGLHSWRLTHAKKGDSGLKLVKNYSIVLGVLKDSLDLHAREYREELLTWYKVNLEDKTSPFLKEAINNSWSDVESTVESDNHCPIHGSNK